MSPICIFVLGAFQISTIFFAHAQTHPLSNGDEAADGLPISIKEDELVLNVSNLFNVSILVVSNRQLEKFGKHHSK